MQIYCNTFLKVLVSISWTLDQILFRSPQHFRTETALFFHATNLSLLHRPRQASSVSGHLLHQAGRRGWASRWRTHRAVALDLFKKKAPQSWAYGKKNIFDHDNLSLSTIPKPTTNCACEFDLKKKHDGSMEPCSYLKSHVDFYMQGMLHAMAPWPAIKTRTVSDSWPIFHVGESLTRQYLVNNGRHIPHTLCEQLIAYRNVNKHLSMSIIFILTEELAAAKRLPYIPPSAARPSGSVKAKSASSGDGLKHKRQVRCMYLTCSTG